MSADKAAAKPATQPVTIGDNVLAAAGTGVGQTATPSRPATPDGLVTITHSATQNITALNSVSCNAGGLHTDNSYIRVFDLAAFGLPNGLDVTECRVRRRAGAGRQWIAACDGQPVRQDRSGRPADLRQPDPHRDSVGGCQRPVSDNPVGAGGRDGWAGLGAGGRGVHTRRPDCGQQLLHRLQR